jgi:hypothetical protein
VCRQTTQSDGATSFAVVHTLGYQVVTLQKNQTIMIRSHPAVKHKKPCSGDHPAEKHGTLWSAFYRVEKHKHPIKCPPYVETQNTVISWSPYSAAQIAVICWQLYEESQNTEIDWSHYRQTWKNVTWLSFCREVWNILTVAIGTEHCHQLVKRQESSTVCSWPPCRQRKHSERAVTLHRNKMTISSFYTAVLNIAIWRQSCRQIQVKSLHTRTLKLLLHIYL